jgi:hypothetical protein
MQNDRTSPLPWNEDAPQKRISRRFPRLPKKNQKNRNEL